MVSERKRRRVHRERACMNGGCIHFDRFCTSVQLRTLFSEYFRLNKLFMKVNIFNDFADFFPCFFFLSNVRKNIA